MLKIKRFEFNLFGVNTYVVFDTATLQAAVVDPGMDNPDICEKFGEWIAAQQLQVVMLVNTHLHIDHTMGNAYVRERYGVGLTACADDAPLGEHIPQQARAFRLRNVPAEPVRPDIEVKQGDFLWLGDEKLEVLQVPGHSPGSIALYSASAGFVITGDALFRGSVGRTDLAGGDHAQLISSIRSRLLSLPPATVVYPGHGPATTIAAELASNPFLR